MMNYDRVHQKPLTRKGDAMKLANKLVGKRKEVKIVSAKVGKKKIYGVYVR